jgi:hypothetical protein
MADLKKALEDLDKSQLELVAKFSAYVEALEKLKDVQKAAQALESAIADTSAKLEAAKKAIGEYYKANKDAIEKDKDRKAALKTILDSFELTAAAIKKAQLHLNRSRA